MHINFLYEESGNDRDAFLEQLAVSEKDLPKASKKYWKDRYSLFERYDEGISLTPELWYSVTTESVAIFLAKFIKMCLPEAKVALDLFCGGGGNTIQFARFFKECYAIDYNETNIKCTLSNAAVYNVRNKVKAVKYDWREITTEKGELLSSFLQENVDFVFASPPWSGPSYTSQKEFDLHNLEPLGLEELLTSCFKISENVCLFLPRNSNLSQLSEVTRKLNKPKCKVLFTSHTGRLKAAVAFWGDCFMY